MELHLAKDRGRFSLPWLDAKYSFSFADYRNPERMGVGALRVLNNDIIAPGGGFDFHPHRDMEIITIPLSGALNHRDSLSNEGTITRGEVQVMSAGTGIVHAEFNASQQSPCELFQLWIIPNKHGVEPRYETMALEYGKNAFEALVSGDSSVAPLTIHQDATISMGVFDAGNDVEIAAHPTHHQFVMIVEGEVQLEEHSLGKRDAFALESGESRLLSALQKTTILLIDVPSLS